MWFNEANVYLASIVHTLGGRTLGTTSDVSPDGAVALVRVQYPAVEHRDASDLDNLKDAVAGGDTAHAEADREMRGRWKNPVKGMGWYRDAKKAFAALPEG